MNLHIRHLVFWKWLAVLVAGLILLSVASCTRDADPKPFTSIEPVDNPHILPYALDVKTRIPMEGDGGHARIGRYRVVNECGGGELAQYELVDDWREGESFSSLVMYADLIHSRALAHYNISTAKFDDDGALDLDHDGICDVATLYTARDTAFLEVFNHRIGSWYKRSIVVGVDRDGSGDWDGRSNLLDCYDVNGDGYRELLIAVDVGYDLYPRQLMCLDVHNDTTLWTYRYAGIVNDRAFHFFQVESGEPPGILLGLSSKGNSASERYMDDQHSYVVVLDMDGTPRWEYETGGVFTRTDPVPVDFDGDGRMEILATVTVLDTVSDSIRPVTYLHVLEASSGELLHTQTLGHVGRVNDFKLVDLDQDGTHELFLCLSVGQILIFDQQLNVLSRARLRGTPSFAASRDILGNGKHQLMITTSDNHLWLLDKSLAVLAQFDCPEKPYHSWCGFEPGADPGEPLQILLAADRGRVYYVLDLTKMPWTRLFALHPSLAFWAAFLPMALVVAVLWFMWSRLRRKNRLIEQQRDELNSAVEDLSVAHAKLIAVEELQRAQSALTASELRFRELADMMPQTLFELDVQGFITYSNHQGFVIFGYEPKDLENGLITTQMFIPEDRDRLFENIRLALQGVEYKCNEYTALRKDGTTFPAMTYVKSIVRDGEVVGLRGILLDISEMKRTARTAREGERKYQALIEVTDTGYLILSEDGRVIDANQEYIRLTGHEWLEDILGRPVTDWTAEHDLERNAAEVQKCFETRSTRNLEIDYVWPDGTMVPVEINAEVVQTEEGIRLLCLCRDITERKRAEEALRMSEERYRGLVEGAGEAIFLMDRSGVYEFMNQIAAERLGGDPDDFVGRNIMELFPEEIAKHYLSMIQRVFDSGEGSLSESPSELKRELRFYRTSLQPIFGADRSIVSVLGIARDITSLVEAQNDLHRERDFVSTLLTTTHSLIICLDHEGRITVFNHECERLTGYERDEVMGKIYVDIFLPDDHSLRRDDRDFSAWAENNVSVSFEAPLVTKSGEVRTILWSNSAQHDSLTDRWSSISVGQDVTDRKLAEDEIRKFATIADRAHYGNAIVDLEGNILYVNDYFAQLHGYTPDELVGGNLAIFHNEKQLLRVQQLNQQLRETGSYENEEVWHVHRDGATFPTIMNGIVIYDESGQPSYMAATTIDISARKSAENALKESEEKYRLLVENVEADIVVADAKGQFLFANRRSAEFFGVPANDMVGKSVRDFFPPVEADRQIANISGVIKTDREYFEETAVNYGGKVSWLSIDILPYRTHPSQPAAALIISRDMTESHDAEEALQESEEKWRDLVMNLPDNIMSVDRSGTILAINWTIPGWTNEQVVGMKATECIAEQYREQAAAAMERVFETGEPATLEVRGDGPEGPFTAFYTTRVVRSSSDPNKVTVISTDITERRKAQNDLRESEQRIRTLLDATTETMILLDTKGTFLALNRTAAERLGYSPDDVDKLVGTSAIGMGEERWTPELLEQRRRTMEGAVRTGKPVRYVDERDGRFFDTHYFPFQDDDGKVNCVAIFAIDITESLEAEQELKQAAEERYEQARRIAGGVAHEIYNALFPANTSIAKLNQRLYLTAPDDLERNRILLDLARRSVERAIDTTGLVKDFTRLESEKSVEPVVLQTIIDEVVATHADRLEQLNVDLRTDLADCTTVLMNRSHVFSIFNNLMSNALDALAGLDLPRTISIQTKRHNGNCRIEFSDNGPGILEPDLGRVFRAFYSTKPAGGTGLGLAMVRRIIELYGGKVRVESMVDKNTTFVILLKQTSIGQID